MEILINVRDTSDNPVLGLTGAHIKFHYVSGGAEKTGLTVTEKGYGAYHIAGFKDDKAEYLTLKINTVVQDWFSSQWIGGIPSLQYMEGIAGNIQTQIDDTVKTTGVQTIGGNKTITGQIKFINSIPLVESDPVNGLPQPTQPGHFTTLEFITLLFGSAIGMIQSTYMIKCIPLRTINDNISKQTLELCCSYLKGLAGITTKRGVQVIEALGLANNVIDVDNGISAWVDNGIDIISLNKAIINRRSVNGSLTSDSRIINCFIKDLLVVPSRQYTNFTFINSKIWIDTDISFTNCNFEGINQVRIDSGDIVLTNCRGEGLWTNGSPIITGTQPADLRAGLDINNMSVY